jgi:pimeloyl-ACP methyl ester carboxylesterase
MGGARLPDTPAGRALADFLAVLNSGDSACLARFIAARFEAALVARFTPDILIRSNARIYELTGGLVPQKVEQASAEAVQVVARPASPVLPVAECRVGLSVATEPPYPITDCWTVALPRVTAERVEVGGRQLAFSTAGSGQPTVVLEAGLGQDRSTWHWIVDAVAQFTRVVAYDRAGRGESDPAPVPRTLREVVADLRRLLTVAGIGGPYIVVGRSYGGLAVRLFAHQYPQDVVGMVLVDASHPDAWARLAAALPAPTADESDALKRDRRYLTEHLHDPQANPEGLHMAQSEAQVRATGLLGDLRLVVLSASEIPSPPGHTADLVVRFEAVAHELQRELATLSTRSTHIVAHSGHFIQWEQPGLVIDAIRELTEAARDANRG